MGWGMGTESWGGVGTESWGGVGTESPLMGQCGDINPISREPLEEGEAQVRR